MSVSADIPGVTGATCVAEETEATASLAAFSPEDYRHHLEGSGICEAEKDELLRLLWNIMCSFVDLGWGVDAVSLVFGTISPSDENAANLPSNCEPTASNTAGARSR